MGGVRVQKAQRARAQLSPQPYGARGNDRHLRLFSVALALGSFKRGNEGRETWGETKLHDLGQEGPFLEHHVRVREVELSW